MTRGRGELRRTGEKSINIQYVVVLVKIMENFRVGVDGVGALCFLLAVALIAKSNPLKPCGSFRHLEVLQRLRLHILNELCLWVILMEHISVMQLTLLWHLLIAEREI